MCKLCDMIKYEQEQDMIYAESDNWVCIGDKETGNPYIIYKNHYNEGMTETIKKEAKAMINLLTVKYWKDMKLNIQGKNYPHIHLIISEAK